MRSLLPSPSIRDRSVVRSSVIPSAKYCCSGSLLRLANGRTTIDRYGVKAGCWAGTAGGVLDALLAQIVERIGQLVADPVVHRAGNADSAGLGERFQPRREIDPVT